MGHDEETARSRAQAMTKAREGEGMAPNGHDLRVQRIVLPWGVTAHVVAAELSH